MSKVYLASSWRNQNYNYALNYLRSAGHEVYDFRNPESHFTWAQIDQSWKGWDLDQYLKALDHEDARKGFVADYAALEWCDLCVLLLPCGRSAHLEAGYCIGKGKDTHIVLDENGFEPELMYLLANPSRIHTSIHNLMSVLGEAS